MKIIPSLENEDGKFYVSNFEDKIALAFEGNADFIRRCKNFITNYGLAFDHSIKISDSFIYIVTTEENLKGALSTYYYGQIIIKGEVSRQEIKDEDGETTGYEWDETSINRLSNEKTNNFIANKIIKSNFISESGCVFQPQEMIVMA